MSDTGLAHKRKQQIFTEHKRLGVLHDLLLRRYAFERFLARLGESGRREAFVLKGAMALIAVTGAFNRPTRDMDMLGLEPLTPDECLAAISEIAATEPSEPDGLRFDVDSFSVETINAAFDEPGASVKGFAYLGTTRIPLKIEVSHGHLVTPEPIDMDYPTVIGGTVPASILCYTKETMLAEKFEAICSLGAHNSRFKDFFDIRELSRTLEFSGATAAEAMRRTFGVRGTPLPSEPPLVFEEDFHETGDRGWKSFLRKQGIKDNQDYDDLVAEIAPFVMAIAHEAAGRAPAGDWTPGEGWAEGAPSPPKF